MKSEKYIDDGKPVVDCKLCNWGIKIKKCPGGEMDDEFAFIHKQVQDSKHGQ